MLLEGETDQEMLEDARIRELLAPHTDPARVDIYRKCVYGFSAVVAEQFSAGRVFLAGDAAHMTPPFAGQGLNAGIRDVRNLSWKLARVLDGSLPRGLLETYQMERHDAAREMVEVAVLLGDQIQPTNPGAAAERDALFAEINRNPAAATAFSDDVVGPLRDIRMTQGWFAEDDCAGRLLPQPEVDGKRLDDRLGRGFLAMVQGAVATNISDHPLWQALAPAIEPLPPALASFAALEPGELLLVRPDRFVIAKLDASNATGHLERLAAMLEAGERQAFAAAG
jgi:3-(3-hydroxy-phenyl)propionate hydroxylase